MCYNDHTVSDYRGSVNVTVWGHPCRPWTRAEQDAHPAAGLAANLCRNPFGKARCAWCYYAPQPHGTPGRRGRGARAALGSGEEPPQELSDCCEVGLPHEAPCAMPAGSRQQLAVSRLLPALLSAERSQPPRARHATRKGARAALGACLVALVAGVALVVRGGASRSGCRAEALAAGPPPSGAATVML